MAYVNVAEWSPEHVADWLRGLDDEIQPYTQFFINNNINGCHLLTLCRDDLTNLNINKIGHQELVLEAVELLRQLHYNLTSETLQSLSLKLGCKSQSLFNNLKHLSQSSADSGKKERVSTETLSAVSDILNLVKSLISWLDRYPFVGQEKYVDVRKSVLKLSVELASTAQRDQFAEMPHEVIKECCLNLAAQSDKIVQEFNDSLIIQPASLEVAKVKRKVDDDLGIHINSSYTGIHIIEDVKFQSPAYRCGKIEEGDEIVQVNYQTVIGWQVKNIICAMREHPSEVHVTLKKRPRHPNVLGQVITLWPYRIPSKKTAFRKLYKWNKGKSTIDIRDVCPTAGEQRSDMSNVAVNGTLPSNEKERNFPAGRSRSRIRRRATVTGVSPTLLQPPVSIEELMGGNVKKKESVGRTVSYDPSKIVNVEDGVFKKDSSAQDKDSSAETGVNGKPNCSSNLEDSKEKNTHTQIGRFLLPPPEFHFGGALTSKKPEDKQKEAPVKEMNSFSSKTAVSDQRSGETCQGSASMKYATPALSVNKLYTHKNQPLPQENSKQLQVDRILKQEKKQDVSESLSGVSSISRGDSNQEESSSSSQFVRDMSPSPRKSNKRTFQFPSRENPQAQEARSMKKIYDSKMPVERTDDWQVTRNSSVLKQQMLSKRNIQQLKIPDNSCVKPSKVKENQLSSKPTENCREQSFNLPAKDPDFYHYPGFFNYSSSHFQHQTHQSKIISLKSKAKENSNYAQAYNNPYLNSMAKYQPNIPPQHNTTPVTQQQQQSSATVNSVPFKTSVGSKKSVCPQSFCSPSGRSLSFNNIAFSSDDSSSDDYEIYEEINERPPPSKPIVPPKPAQLRPENNPAFAAKIAEVYSMLCQGNSFLPAHKNNNYGNRISPESSAMIDELARRMYLALHMNHLKSQTVDQSNYVHPSRGHYRYVHPNNMVPQNQHYQQHVSNIPKSFGEQCPPQVNVSYLNLYNTPHNATKNIPDSGYATLNNADVNGHSVKLPASDPLLSRHPNMFKSATSQEIHNIYTSQGANKPAPGANDSHCFSKQMSSVVHQNGSLFLDPTYEVLSSWQNRKQNLLSENKKDASSIRSVNYGESMVICPAEKESENELPCRDTPEVNSLETKSERFASMPLSSDKHFESPGLEELSKNASELPRNKECIFSGCELKDPEKLLVNGEIKTGCISSEKKLQPTIMSLMSNMPKPPELDDNDAAVTKSSSAQTDIDIGDTDTTCFDSTHIKTNNPFCEINNTINDDSFPSSLNCSQISTADSTNVSYTSSLNSSPSGSVISSAGSCYYYADTRTQSQMGSHLPSVSSDILDEDSLPEALRSSVLPTMGVSMLSKKRNSSSSSSSEPGSSIRPSTCTSLTMEESASNISKVPGIITDVEHTF